MDGITKNKEMKNSQQLYGVLGSTFKDMMYEDVLNYKIDLASEMISKLIDVHYSTRNNEQINKCLDSIRFNSVLLKELID